MLEKLVFVIMSTRENTRLITRASSFLKYNFFDFICRYHLGSLAFGSLLIAIVQIVRVILEYIDSKLNGSENRIAKFLLK